MDESSQINHKAKQEIKRLYFLYFTFKVPTTLQTNSNYVIQLVMVQSKTIIRK